MQARRPALADIQKLVCKALLPMYCIKRDIPIPLSPRQDENDAEHSWSVAMLACSLAPHVDSSLDVGAICQFAVIHDMVELYAGDTPVWGSKKGLQTKAAREAAALAKVCKEFAAFPWLTNTLQIYQQQEVAEARYVRTADKCMSLLFDYIDECRYHREHAIDLNGFVAGMQAHRRKAQVHAGLFEYYDEIWQAILNHPEFFESGEISPNQPKKQRN